MKMPTCFFTDILAIFFDGASFNDKHELYGKLVEQLFCCTTSKKYLSQVWAYGNNNSPRYSEKNVAVENHTGNAAGINFKLIQPYVFPCKTITTKHIPMINDILTYLSYGISVRAGYNFTLTPAYCHKQVSLGSISIGGSKGGPSFSTSGAVIKKEYIADKITKTAFK